MGHGTALRALRLVLVPGILIWGWILWRIWIA